MTSIRPTSSTRTLAWALALPIALGLLGCGTSSIANVTPNPRERTDAEIAQRSLGPIGTCFLRLSILPEVPEDLDDQLAALGGKGMVAEHIYAGTIAEAAAAFGGEVISGDEGRPAWITGELAGDRVVWQLRPHESEAGARVWVRADLMRVAHNNECGEDGASASP